MTWTYDPSQLSTSAFMQVRFMIGDTLTGDQQIQDEEIQFALTLDPSIWRVAATCCRSIAAQLSRQADSVQGELRTLYSSRSKAYATRAASYENTAVARGGGLPYAGGISIADKLQQEQNSDRVDPQFQIGMDDNLIPVGEVGNVSTSAPAPVQE